MLATNANSGEDLHWRDELYTRRLATAARLWLRHSTDTISHRDWLVGFANQVYEPFMEHIESLIIRQVRNWKTEKAALISMSPDYLLDLTVGKYIDHRSEPHPVDTAKMT
jgi:hypothetical protein